MGNGVFNSTVIGEGGAYFSVKDHGQLGYAMVDTNAHMLRCPHAPLWFLPEGFMPWFLSHLKPVPEDGNLLKDCGVENNPFEEAETLYLKREKEGSHRLIVLRAEAEKESPSTIDEGEVPDSFVEVEKEKFTEKDAEAEKENVVEKAEEKELTEEAFLSRLSEAAEKSGFLYNEEDLTNFHISVKSSRLTILAGMSGTGKSGLVRLYGKALGLPEERVRFLPVRPSWMDDGDILGYVDMKNMVYRSADTGLAELLIDAAKNPDKMYLLCFDEMNLARAEHYFAQFISVLEKEDNPVIRLYNPSLRSRLYNGEAYPAEIPIGKNIIFTGTVNVDESTYHSPTKSWTGLMLSPFIRENFTTFSNWARKKTSSLKKFLPPISTGSKPPKTSSSMKKNWTFWTPCRVHWKQAAFRAASDSVSPARWVVISPTSPKEVPLTGKKALMQKSYSASFQN